LSADGLMTRLAFTPVAPDSPDVGTVTDQNPPGGAEAHAGDVVTITVGTAGPPTTSSPGAPSSTPPPPPGTPTATETAATAPASAP
jgi:beta-lactam-binding protein with PASTA domain